MRYIKALCNAAESTLQAAQPISTDLRGHNPQIDSYDVPAEHIELLRQTLEPALRSLSAIIRKQNQNISEG